MQVQDELVEYVPNTGDIIFVDSATLLSRLGQLLQGLPYSHVGIIIVMPDGPYVAEIAIGYNTPKLIALPLYLKDHLVLGAAVRRLRQRLPQTHENAIKATLANYGHISYPKDMMEVFRRAFKTATYQQPTHMRDTMICSELIQVLLEQSTVMGNSSIMMLPQHFYPDGDSRIDRLYVREMLVLKQVDKSKIKNILNKLLGKDIDKLKPDMSY